MKKIIIAVIFIALIGGIWLGYQHEEKNNYSSQQTSTIFSPPQEITKFSLVDTNGKPFDNNALWGQWTFLFFGFTQCPQICPIAMANLKQMYEILLQQKQSPMPQVVLISVDPEHDTLPKLKNYVVSFNPHFQGATGDPAALDKLAASLNILVFKDKQGNIDHSGTILLIDPAGKLIAVFSAPHDPAAMAKNFSLIVKNSG
jgi:protein SCO1/2